MTQDYFDRIIKFEKDFAIYNGKVFKFLKSQYYYAYPDTAETHDFYRHRGTKLEVRREKTTGRILGLSTWSEGWSIWNNRHGTAD